MNAVKTPSDDIGVLTPLHGKPYSKPVIAFDVETYGTKNRFVLGCISTQHGNYEYDDPELMLIALSHTRFYGCDIYATNLHFDAFTLFQEVAGERGIPEGWSAFDNGSKLIWCKKTLQERTKKQQAKYLSLLDSMNLFPLGVYNLGAILAKVAATYAREGEAELAAYYSVRKLESPACMGKKKLSSLTPEERRQLQAYCNMDAEVTRKFMQWANGEIVKLGAMPRITAASTAMDLFRRKYLDSTIPQPSWDCLVDSRFSYYGGRTEDYAKGNVGAGYEQDFTAMYPSCMEELNFPFPSPENFTKVKKPSDSVLEYEGFARVTITVPELEYPPLPYRANDHLLFPVGTLSGVWTHVHLREAIKLGCELERIEWSYYNTHTFNPFAGYVRELIKLRMQYLCPGCSRFDKTGRRCWEDGVKCENAHATEEVIKLFLNGLYGKFAQNFLTEKQAAKYQIAIKKGGGTFKPLAEASAREIAFTRDTHPEYLARGIAIDEAVPSLKAFMNPILAAYITSQAQVKLNRAQWKAHSYGIPTWYVDTDSLLTPKPLPFATKAKRLGEIQLAGSFDELIIIGPKAKMTREGEKRKPTFKGVPSKSWIVDDPDTMETHTVTPRRDIFDSMTSDTLSVSFTRMAKYRESVHRGLSANEMLLVTKEFKPFDNPKRKILGKPSIRGLLKESYASRPWKISSKGVMT